MPIKMLTKLSKNSYLLDLEKEAVKTRLKDKMDNLINGWR